MCGLGFVTFLLLIACLRYSRAIGLEVLGELGGLLSCACFLFLAVRAGDLILAGTGPRGVCLRQNEYRLPDRDRLILVPAVALLFKRVRQTPRSLLKTATLACLGGTFYRFVPTTIAFFPARSARYFPTFPELLMAIAYISLAIVGFSLAVKYFAVLPGNSADTNYRFRGCSGRLVVEEIVRGARKFMKLRAVCPHAYAWRFGRGASAT